MTDAQLWTVLGLPRVTSHDKQKRDLVRAASLPSGVMYDDTRTGR
jgi:hypothetical protein